MRKTALVPGQLLRFVQMEKSYHGKAGYPVLDPPLEVAPGQRKTHVNSYRRQTVHRGKVDPGVSELPRGNELSRDHVNRPLVQQETNLDMCEVKLRSRTKPGYVRSRSYDPVDAWPRIR